MILGITGTNGAGKGTVVQYLVAKKGFTHYSIRAAIIEEIKRRGLSVDRPTLNEVATDLRRTHGPAYFTTLFMEDMQKRRITHCAMESIRNPEEAKNIKKNGGFTLVVDADEHVRYTRIMSRASETDQVSFEEFKAHEAREMTSEDASDPAYMDIAAVIRMADVTLINNGTLEELHAQIDSALKALQS